MSKIPAPAQELDPTGDTARSGVDFGAVVRIFAKHGVQFAIAGEAGKAFLETGVTPKNDPCIVLVVKLDADDFEGPDALVRALRDLGAQAVNAEQLAKDLANHSPVVRDTALGTVIVVAPDGDLDLNARQTDGPQWTIVGGVIVPIVPKHVAEEAALSELIAANRIADRKRQSEWEVAEPPKLPAPELPQGPGGPSGISASI